MDKDEAERQIADLKRQLEAAQTAPAGGFMGALSLVGSVVGLVPRPLLVAAGIVVVAWAGLEMYQNAAILADQKIKADTDAQNAIGARGGKIEDWQLEAQTRPAQCDEQSWAKFQEVGGRLKAACKKAIKRHA
jgi:hypothetical protein